MGSSRGFQVTGDVVEGGTPVESSLDTESLLIKLRQEVASASNIDEAFRLASESPNNIGYISTTATQTQLVCVIGETKYVLWEQK